MSRPLAGAQFDQSHPGGCCNTVTLETVRDGFQMVGRIDQLRPQHQDFVGRFDGQADLIAGISATVTVIPCPMTMLSFSRRESTSISDPR